MQPIQFMLVNLEVNTFGSVHAFITHVYVMTRARTNLPAKVKTPTLVYVKKINLLLSSWFCATPHF